MFDKRFAYTLAGIAVVAALAFSLGQLPESGVTAEMNEPVEHAELTEPPEDGAEEDTAPEEPVYLMREYDGFIAVYQMGESEPFLVLDTRVNFLPDYDRILLEKGIEVSGTEALAALIEDYIS